MRFRSEDEMREYGIVIDPSDPQSAIPVQQPEGSVEVSRLTVEKCGNTSTRAHGRADHLTDSGRRVQTGEKCRGHIVVDDRAPSRGENR